MAARNRVERTQFHAASRSCRKETMPRKRGAKTCASTAMVPATVLSDETLEYAKGVIMRWGKMIAFVDDNPFSL